MRSYANCAGLKESVTNIYRHLAENVFKATRNLIRDLNAHITQLFINRFRLKGLIRLKVKYDSVQPLRTKEQEILIIMVLYLNLIHKHRLIYSGTQACPDFEVMTILQIHCMIL